MQPESTQVSEPLSSPSRGIIRGQGFVAMWRAMRPSHWVKNLVVFAAPVFAMALDAQTWLLALASFALFSMMASGVYLLNDVADRGVDRQHPVKRNRPVASGQLSPRLALGVSALLMGISLGLGFLVTGHLGMVLVGYVLIQAGYNLKLKHVAVMDLMCISAGFVFRALAGAAATGIPPSSWFILCVGLLAFYLALKKREAELRDVDQQTLSTRAVLSQYTLTWLNQMERVITPAIVITYTLWAIEGSRTDWMLATVPFVLYGLFMYQWRCEQGHGETPDAALFKFPELALTVLLWLIATLLIQLYLT